MKIINVMNFVRQCEPRWEEVDRQLFAMTKSQMKLLKEMDVDHTFLLQYDTLCDSKYSDFFKKEATEKTELGLWFEVVKELTEAVGIPYRSEYGWSWDWHIIPGFSMGYTVSEREALIDEAMQKFKSVYGYYPKTVGSWMMDSHTITYLSDHYEISAFCNCRDQVNTDAYTMVGGYFNQGYYPSRKNMFTPAQTKEMQLNAPMFRLLGPDPIHNYDGKKYLSKDCKYDMTCYTMEAVWMEDKTDVVDWFYKTYFENEDMGFSYAQIGQENSFANYDLCSIIRMQIEKAKKIPGVQFMKMGDTGEWFKKQYPEKTPVTAVTAMDNWDEEDVQSVYYDSQFYTANLFRHEKEIFLRACYAFDEHAEDRYLKDVCTTFDAVYENQPIVDTVIWENEVEKCGMYFDHDGEPFSVKRIGEEELEVSWKEKKVVFDARGMTLYNTEATFYPGKAKAEITITEDAIWYLYRGRKYALKVVGGKVKRKGDCIVIMPCAEKIELQIVIITGDM